ncbi:MAG: hypothetical protein Q9227_009075 [Pyrenula ochraceoflavens]
MSSVQPRFCSSEQCEIARKDELNTKMAKALEIISGVKSVLGGAKPQTPSSAVREVQALFNELQMHRAKDDLTLNLKDQLQKTEAALQKAESARQEAEAKVSEQERMLQQRHSDNEKEILHRLDLLLQNSKSDSQANNQQPQVHIEAPAFTAIDNLRPRLASLAIRAESSPGISQHCRTAAKSDTSPTGRISSLISDSSRDQEQEALPERSARVKKAISAPSISRAARAQAGTSTQQSTPRQEDKQGGKRKASSDDSNRPSKKLETTQDMIAYFGKDHPAFRGLAGPGLNRQIPLLDPFLTDLEFEIPF